MFKRITVFLAGLMLSAAALATPTPPTDMIRGTTDQMRGLITQNHEAYKKDSTGFYKTVDDVLVPHFDVKRIAQIILARNWKTASDDQRTRFQNAFKNMLVHNYADELLEYYDSVKMDYKPARVSEDGTDATVDSSINRQNGKPPIAITFKLHLNGDQWLVYDVIVENVSLVINFRAQVESEIKRTSLDDVIARMEKGELIKPATTNEGKPASTTGSAG